MGNSVQQLALGGAGVSLLVAALSLGAQEAQPQPDDGHLIVVKGPDLPMYSLAQAFFDHALIYRRDRSSKRYHRLREDLGIEPGSEAAERLDFALTEAEAVLAMRTVNPELDNAEDYWNFQMKALREKARALGHVYGTLLRDLGRMGDSDERLRRYLEEEVRPDTSMWTTNEWPTEVLSAVGSFDDEVEAVLRGEKP